MEMYRCRHVYSPAPTIGNGTPPGALRIGPASANDDLAAHAGVDRAGIVEVSSAVERTRDRNRIRVADVRRRAGLRRERDVVNRGAARPRPPSAAADGNLV